MKNIFSRRVRAPEEREDAVGKCAYCNDPIYDFQEFKVNGIVISLHKGCLNLVAKE